MFRQITAILLIIAFSAQAFNQAVIVLNYYANPAAFAKICENKALPKMHCNGKCQMMKKLKEEEKKEQQAPEKKNNNNELVYLGSNFTSLELIESASYLSNLSYNSTSLPLGLPTAIFHPPGLV